MVNAQREYEAGQEFTAGQWDRFKDWKLGDLRSPIETLQSIVQEHGADEPWWESARESRLVPNGKATVPR